VAQIPHFHIAFDTNLLFVEAENKLIRDAFSEFILERNKIDNPSVTWHLIDVVKAERRYQMLQVALRLLTQVEKVGKLLGKDFGITNRSLEHGVDMVIFQEVKRHNLRIRKLDVELVDWPALIERSTSRDPPFEAGKTEKGFRDSIILETFAQLVDEVSSAKAQRFVLMTNDGRLKDAAATRMKGKDYVSTVDDVQTLKSMLNAFASHVGGHELKELLEKAQRLFYREDDKEALFYKWNVEQVIKKDHESILLEPPPWTPAGTFVSARLSSVGPTTFIEKTDQRLTFATYLDFETLAAIPTSIAPPVYSADPYRSTNALYPGIFTGSFSPSTDTATGIGSLHPMLGTTIGGSGTLYPSGSGPTPSAGIFYAGGSTSALGAGILYPSGGASALGLNPLYPNTATAFVNTGSAYPAAGMTNFIYQSGLKVFEVKWCAALDEAGELKDPDLREIRLLSTDWQ
jgi:hypothetical protein